MSGGTPPELWRKACETIDLRVRVAQLLYTRKRLAMQIEKLSFMLAWMENVSSFAALNGDYLPTIEDAEDAWLANQ